MMYNVARALALIGLVGVSATNHTNTTSSGSTAPPQSGGCTAFDAASGSTLLIGRRSLAADRRQLSNHTSGNSNCEDDVPQCLYFYAELDGFQVSGSNASCPTSYNAGDATLLKDAVKRAVCAGGDTNNCYNAVEAALSFKLKCKLKSAADYGNAALASPARRLSGTDVTMHLVAAVTLKTAKVGTFTAEKIGEALFALSQVAALAKVTEAVKGGFNAAAVVSTSSAVFTGHKTNANIVATKAAITVSNHDCNGIGKLSLYKTHCEIAAAASKAKCTNFRAGTGNNNTPSNAVSFILSSAVLAVAALI